MLSLARMLVATNDAFIGVNSLALWTDGQPTRVTLPLIAWDAGTEDNAEIGAGFDAGQPDPAIGALNVDNGTTTVGGVVALHTQFTGVQGWFTITPIESTISVGSGLSLIGWTNSATTSTALIAANPDTDVLWFWDGTAWQSDTAALPIGLRTAFAINPGDAMFVVTGAATEITISLAWSRMGRRTPTHPQPGSAGAGSHPRQAKDSTIQVESFSVERSVGPGR